ncbi:hypothetical protein pb186bvf_003133 [Paramecium bursaria]
MITHQEVKILDHNLNVTQLIKHDNDAMNNYSQTLQLYSMNYLIIPGTSILNFKYYKQIRENEIQLLSNYIILKLFNQQNKIYIYIRYIYLQKLYRIWVVIFKKCIY